MTRLVRRASALSLLLATPAIGAEDAPRPAGPQGSPSFVVDVAPILSKHCVGCHNARKSEGRYDLTSIAKLARGAQGGEIAITPGDPRASRLVEVIRPDGEPRMPHRQAPLAAEKVAVIERWVAEGAKHDAVRPDEDWVALVHKQTPVVIPDSYGSPVPISALAFRPDGRAVLTSGYHEVISWDATEGRPGRRIQGLPERIQAISYSPDGRWLAAAGGDPGLLGSARLWRVAPGDLESPRDLVEGQDGFFAVAFSPDSQLVAVGGADRAIRIWDVETGRLVTTIEDHADWVLGLAFSPDGKKIATASRDRTSKVFDVRTKESLVAFGGHADAVYSVAFSPDGSLVATGGGDNQVRVWSPEDGKPARSFAGFGGAVLRVAYTPDGRDLVASSADGTVRAFRGDRRRLELRGHGDWVYSLAISPDGRRLASGSWDGEVRFWDLEDGKASLAFRAAPGLKRPAIAAADGRK
jgi:WD40 repeat protein